MEEVVDFVFMDDYYRVGEVFWLIEIFGFIWEDKFC